MKQLIILISLAIVLGGCERSLDSGDLGFGPPERLPVPVALKVLHLNDGIELSWQISDTETVAHFNIYYAVADDIEYSFLDSTSAFSLTITNLNSGQVYNFKVAAVGTNELEGSQSSSVSTQVGITSLVINGNDEFTNDRDVSITYVYPVTPILMQMSENPLLTDVAWMNFHQPGSFRLSDGDGIKHLYVSFKFGDGSESAQAVSDSIILDTRAFIDSTYFIADSSILLAGDTITFYVDGGETGGSAYVSFPGHNRLNLFDDGLNGDIIADDGIYTRRYIVPIDLEVSDGVVTGNFIDAAGNSAETAPASDYLNIVIPPEPITLQTVAASSSAITLSWSEVSAGQFTFSAYRIYRDISTDVDEFSEMIAGISSRTTTSYTDNDLEDNQLYVYRVYAYCTEGLIAKSDESSATTMVNLPPSAVTLGVGLADSLIINISWTRNNDSDFESYQIYRGSTADVTDLTGQRITAISDQNLTSCTDIRFSSLETYYYVLYVYDRQGLKSAKSNVESTP